VRPIEKFEPVFDEAHMPKPVDVPQDIDPWESAIRTLLSDRDAYWNEASQAREAAAAFVSKLRASDFEDLLERISPGIAAPAGRREQAPAPPLDKLSPAKRALLLQRLRKIDKP
jgi:hypothetical protein